MKASIVLTWSKIMAAAVLLLGSALSFYLKSEGIFMTTISAVTLILGIKQVTDIKTKKE